MDRPLPIPDHGATSGSADSGRKMNYASSNIRSNIYGNYLEQTNQPLSISTENEHEKLNGEI
jgi:hypothetical protein